MGNGSLVNINITATHNVALLNITLPIKPMGPIIVQSSNGSSIPAILINNRLIIPVFGNGTFVIRYVPLAVQSVNGYLIINVSSQYPVNLFISNNVLLTQLPTNLITNFTKVNSGAILQLAPGNYSIGFIPELWSSRTTSANITSTSRSALQHTFLYNIIIPVIIIIAAISILTYVLITRHRGSKVDPVIIEGLNPTDREVLGALVDMGGEAYQVDLQKKLGMPKATLWRAIRRLEEAGYVRVIREGRMNRIKLVKRPGPN
ncbi:MAG: helix-turn-helix transcriptional regulator [Vulcanisaeta sp. AZ3]|jgi:uncharacterized membrane protein